MSRAKESSSSETTQMKIALYNRQLANIVVAIDYDEDGTAVPTIVFCGDQSSAANARFDDLKDLSHDSDDLHVFENVPFNVMLASPYADSDGSDDSDDDDESGASENESDKVDAAPEKNDAQPPAA